MIKKASQACEAGSTPVFRSTPQTVVNQIVTTPKTIKNHHF